MIVTHILFLAALLQMEETAPKAISPHKNYDDCAIAAAKANRDEALKTPQATEMGLRYVCMKLVADT